MPWGNRGMDCFAEANRIGEVACDGASATSERVLLRAPVNNRRHLNRNQYVRIKDEEGPRTGFLARIVAGPFFVPPGTSKSEATEDSITLTHQVLADLEIQGELVSGRLQDTNTRPAPGSAVYALNAEE